MKGNDNIKTIIPPIRTVYKNITKQNNPKQIWKDKSNFCNEINFLLAENYGKCALRATVCVNKLSQDILQ